LSKKDKKRKWPRRLLIGLAVVAGLILILIILFQVVMTSVSALSRAKDPKKAKERGDELLAARNQTIVTVSGHPDDVDYWSSGTLAKLHRNGNKIIMVIGTSGEQGANVPNLGRIREQLQRKAGKIVGYDKIIFLRHPDRGLKPNRKFKDELRKIFSQYQPDILFTFDIEKEAIIYHHSDHEAAGKAALAVAPEFKSIRSIYEFHTRAPNVIVDIDGVTAIKSRAMAVDSTYQSRGGGPRSALRILGFLRFLDRGNNSRRNSGRFASDSYEGLGVENSEVFRLVKNK
jgi:LmbE family N-acetylglucosaminyl deacetylase